MVGFLALSAESIPEDHFDQQMNRRAGCTDADAEIKFTVGRQIQIEIGNDLLLLKRAGIKISDRSQNAVILDAGIDFLGDIEAGLEVR